MMTVNAAGGMIIYTCEDCGWTRRVAEPVGSASIEDHKLQGMALRQVAFWVCDHIKLHEPER